MLFFKQMSFIDMNSKEIIMVFNYQQADCSLSERIFIYLLS